MRTIALVFLLSLLPAVGAALSGCAALPQIISAAIPIADRALDWISQIERHATPLLDRVDAPTAARVRDAIPTARAAAVAVRDCGRASEGTGGTIDCTTALADLERELEALFAAGRPFGVQPVDQPGLLGAPPGGVGVLGVPSACAIVRGEAACAAAPGGDA